MAKNPKISIQDFINFQGVDKYNADSMVMKFRNIEDMTYNQWYSKLQKLYAISAKKDLSDDSKKEEEKLEDNNNNSNTIDN